MKKSFYKSYGSYTSYTSYNSDFRHRTGGLTL